MNGVASPECEIDRHDSGVEVWSVRLQSELAIPGDSAAGRHEWDYCIAYCTNVGAVEICVPHLSDVTQYQHVAIQPDCLRDRRRDHVRQAELEVGGYGHPAPERKPVELTFVCLDPRYARLSLRPSLCDEHSLIMRDSGVQDVHVGAPVRAEIFHH